ncbi:permease, PerM family [Luminiphilus syltensis NOR5-1B]|uniref:Permease, PerM family n=1 Tax=Luminiphilus syltensis NOR5-1B TaxID=565045 RepID=B8KWW8_9GAMM|nr:AI-2E family transporter [Luminiphilus syltensis]EED35287.1 permease, PerM family [Luminiphilus syltensis NOR5-1B]
MFEVFQKWYHRYFSEEESVVLLIILVSALVVLITIGDVLTPVLVALVLAYLMQGVANQLAARGVPQSLGVWIALLLFMGVFFGSSFGLVPLIWQQLASLLRESPEMIEQVSNLLNGLAAEYPQLISQQQVEELLGGIQRELAQFGQVVLARSLSRIPGLLALLVYMVLIPMLVFFFLKDQQKIFAWFSSFLPERRPLLQRIWQEMDQQVSNYVRGKVIEIIIVGSTSYLAFTIMGLNYAALLGLLVGLSVIIPYIGATLVTVPVVMVAYFQWGVGSELYAITAAYLVIQLLDGNVLVPLLFSEAVNLHPVAIIIAVLFFGGIWGLWGVFFAIPLATLVNAVLCAWPARLDSPPNPAS